MRSWKGFGSIVAAGVLCLPVWADVNPNGRQAPQPGSLNYIEGQATIAGQPVNPNSVGSAQLQAGQSLATQSGKAELLLTPGVLLRLDSNSAVLMNSPDIANTELTLQGGRAMVEADSILPANRIVI